MLKQETYELWADGFAASIGVAQTIRYNSLDGDDGISPMVYSKFTRQMSGNKKILKAISDDKYIELQREMYKISKGDKRLVENTIIKRAFDKIYGKEKTIAKG
jgi:hypothetical protein